MKFYVTKYALTQGILEKEGELVDSIQKGQQFLKCKNHFPIMDEYYHGDDFHETKEKAILHAESMIINKIESLRKKILKLENIDFENE